MTSWSSYVGAASSLARWTLVVLPLLLVFVGGSALWSALDRRPDRIRRAVLLGLVLVPTSGVLAVLGMPPGLQVAHLLGWWFVFSPWIDGPVSDEEHLLLTAGTDAASLSRRGVRIYQRGLGGVLVVGSVAVSLLL